jgi:hypothetical protein
VSRHERERSMPLCSACGRDERVRVPLIRQGKRRLAVVDEAGVLTGVVVP